MVVAYYKLGKAAEGLFEGGRVHIGENSNDIVLLIRDLELQEH